MDRSFNVTRLDLPAFDAPWHFHPEYELTFIDEGTGTRFVGDNIERFTVGDCVLLGPNLPHHWRSDLSSNSGSRAIVIQFPESSVPKVPELSAIWKLLDDSRYGISFPKVDSIEFDETYLGFLELLGSLTIESQRRTLAKNPDPKTSQRLTRACDFIFENLSRPISLAEVAKAAAMSPSAFSRYFKKHTGQPLTHFIADHRVAEAARQLLDSDRGIAEIAFDTGFGSISAFNRHFKQFRGQSPKDFRARYR